MELTGRACTVGTRHKGKVSLLEFFFFEQNTIIILLVLIVNDTGRRLIHKLFVIK